MAWNTYKKFKHAYDTEKKLKKTSFFKKLKEVPDESGGKNIDTFQNRSPI